MYKKASKKQLRIETQLGLLSVEQLWDLPLSILNDVAMKLDKKLDSSSGKSYIKVKASEDNDAQLMRDIVVDIIETKQKDAEKASKALATRQRNQNILELIEKKKQGNLEELDIDKLEAMLE